jgi:hypothetical protein
MKNIKFMQMVLRHHPKCTVAEFATLLKFRG